MSTPGHVFALRDAEYLDRGNGVRSLPLAGPNSGSDQILSGISEIPAGGEIPLHHHNTDEFVLVIEGQAVVTIDGAEHNVEGGDSTLVFAGVRHRYVNVGEGRLRILWVYGDVNTTRTIAATGLTLGHLERYSPT
ncbi:MAG: cupin domain-containing protein [Propionibacteriales bacterium]|nr:cupin domain-containing protein [Propionibacteriales bacterium]